VILINKNESIELSFNKQCIYQSVKVGGFWLVDSFLKNKWNK